MMSRPSHILVALLISLSYSSSLFSLEYGIIAKNKHVEKIINFFVIGERCSGTNFLTSLISENTQLIKCRIGQKHFPPWYELGPEYYHGDARYYHFNNTEDFLFLVIFRDPYDWVRSFHIQPHHAHKSLLNLSFSSFIREPWLIDPSVTAVENYPLLDLNPKDGLPFKNIFALRSRKIEDMLEIQNRAPNVYYINYEIVRDYPEQVLKEIAHLYNLQLKSSYTAIDSYKGAGKTNFKPIAYKPISDLDLEYINSQLDKKLEERIGYKIS